MNYQPRHFAPHELLPGLSGDETWITLDPVLRVKLDDRLLETCDDVRDLLGTACSINDYARGGKRQWCGLRTPDCTIGAPKSQHRIGKAADLHPSGMTAEMARTIVRNAVAAGKLPYLGGMELNVSWLHIDVRPRVDGKVLEFHA